MPQHAIILDALGSYFLLVGLCPVVCLTCSLQQLYSNLCCFWKRLLNSFSCIQLSFSLRFTSSIQICAAAEQLSAAALGFPQVCPTSVNGCEAAWQPASRAWASPDFNCALSEVRVRAVCFGRSLCALCALCADTEQHFRLGMRFGDRTHWRSTRCWKSTAMKNTLKHTTKNTTKEQTVDWCYCSFRYAASSSAAAASPGLTPL